MRPPLLLPLLAAVLAAASGCRHDGTGEPRALAAPAHTGAGAPSALDAALNPSAIAGVFGGPGVRLVVAPDGRYSLHADAAGPGADEVDSAGLWTLESGSGQLLLVPHAADAPRLRFGMPSADELAPEDGGRPLHRERAVAAR